MRCPVCDSVDLVMSERQGVEIDYCPRCRGVWLDRGELDKILERSAQAEPQRPQGRGEDAGRGREHERERESHGYKKKKGSFLGELFDF